MFLFGLKTLKFKKNLNDLYVSENLLQRITQKKLRIP
jgi:hypothetical protein